MKTYELCECSVWYTTIQADSLEHALKEAERNVDRANYPTDPDEPERTLYIDVRVREIDAERTPLGDEAESTVTLHPAEPDYAQDGPHDWHSPYSVLGGDRSNPGVWGHGSGVIIRAVCAHCGTYQVTDTWAQRMDTGEQGLREVRYEPADETSLAWVRERECSQS